MGAVSTAIELSITFDTVPNNPATAVGADRRQLLNSALEAIKGIAPSIYYYVKGFIIFVVADCALSHEITAKCLRAKG